MHLAFSTLCNLVVCVLCSVYVSIVHHGIISQSLLYFHNISIIMPQKCQADLLRLFLKKNYRKLLLILL